MGKTVCFLLSGRLCNPVGGHKIVYQYANALADRGHRVLIVNNIFRPSALPWYIESSRKVYSFFRNVYRSIRRENSCRRWFELKPGVIEMQVWTYDVKSMPAADYYVATNALTAPYLLDYRVQDSHKFYFIQGYESWLVGEEELTRTFHYPYKKIVISEWLRKKLADVSEDAIVIPSGYDNDRFSLDIPITDKEKLSLSILYHEMPEKNFSMGLEVIDKVKTLYPDLKVFVFGVYPRPSCLPDWCDYYQSPDAKTHNHINNVASIYLGTSSNEGLGLTVLEAMVCGQAVVCTDIDGYKEVAKHNETALLSPVGDAHQMAENVIRLIEDDGLRMRLAATANERIKLYSAANGCRSFSSLFD